MGFIERDKVRSKALAKRICRNNLRLIYITGPIGIGKRAFGQRLRERLLKLNRGGLSISEDVRNYKLSVEIPNISSIFKGLFISCFDFEKDKNYNLNDFVNNTTIKNTTLILSVYHIEHLISESNNQEESIKDCVNLILDNLPKCFIIFTSNIRKDFIDKVKKFEFFILFHIILICIISLIETAKYLSS